jgi:hypothetical protein
MKNLLIIPLLLLIGCKKDVSVKSTERQVASDSITQVFIDSTHIGVKGKYKLELKRISSKDSIYADIHFFEKKDTKWIEKQHFTFEQDDVAGCDPEYKDFNNDGFNDFTYVPILAARGANEVRSLFIFDPELSILRYMKNSRNYPNLEYNKELDCIDAFAVYGGSSSEFLKIEKDSLRQFARIDLFDGYREVYKIDKTGKETLIKRDPYESSQIRFKNFDPLEEYGDF